MTTNFGYPHLTEDHIDYDRISNRAKLACRVFHENMDGWIAAEKIGGFGNGQLVYLRDRECDTLYAFKDNPDRIVRWRVAPIHDHLICRFDRLVVGTPEHTSAKELLFGENQ
jgi:hypothetical protein